MLVLSLIHVLSVSDSNLQILEFPTWSSHCMLTSKVALFVQPKRRDFALLVNYYGKRGDKHSARAAFENMCAAGIDANVHVYTK